MTTLYDTLGVNEQASTDELKRAYRKAMMKWHPDRNAGNEVAAHAAFQDVRAAYAILSDPLQRREYDAIFAAEMRRWARAHADGTGTGAAAAARAQGESATRSQGKAETQSWPYAKTKAPPQAKAEAQPRTRAEAQRRAEAETQSQARAEAPSQARPQTQSQTRTEARPQTETQPQAAARSRADADAQARYAERVAIAMRYAGEGYNRDVVFGVLLGRQCDVLEARRIADSVSAWQSAHSAHSAGATSSASAGPTRPASASADPVMAKDGARNREDSTARSAGHSPPRSTGDEVARDPADMDDASSADAEHSTAHSARASETAEAPRGTRRRSRAGPTGKRHDDNAPVTDAATNPGSTAEGTDPAKDPATPSHLFGALWYHFLNGLRP